MVINFGESFLSKIEGMFAFAIYDKKNIVILARDRAGENLYIIIKFF